jgi:hypothetical protein
MQFTIHRFFASTKNNIQVGSTILALSLVMLTSCQKETTGIPGTSSLTEEPPAGFVFPHTYFVNTSLGPYEVYNNGRILNPAPYSKEHYFKEAIDEFNNEVGGLQITFVDKTNASIPGLENLKYFFKNRILHLHLDQDTIEYGTGNYNEFSAYYNMIYYSKHIEGGGFSKQSYTIMEPNPISLPRALVELNIGSVNNIKELDTLVLNNITLTFK